MKIKPEELSTNNYILFGQFNHLELVPFVQEYMRKRTAPVIIFYALNFVFFVALVFFFAKYIAQKQIEIGDGLAYVGIGAIVAMLIIPIHEYIHIVAYRTQGAQQTSYDMNLKQFYFLAVADKFVANKTEFQLVALAPFVVITAIALTLLFFSGPLLTLAILSTVFIHTSCCSGDFALLSYFSFHKNKSIVTFDDKTNKVSYFYQKIG